MFFISFKHSIISFLPQTYSYISLTLSEGSFLLDQPTLYQIKRVSLLFMLLHLFSSLFCESVKKRDGTVHIIKMEKWRDKEAKGLFGISNLVAKPSGQVFRMSSYWGCCLGDTAGFKDFALIGADSSQRKMIPTRGKSRERSLIFSFGGLEV